MLRNLFLFAVCAIGIVGCGSCSAPQKVGIVTVDTVKCAVEYPLDVILQTASLVEKFKSSDLGFVETLMLWAREAKDGKFATCVLLTVSADFEKLERESTGDAGVSVALVTTPSLSQKLRSEVDQFKQSRFGEVQFEPVVRQ